MYRKRTAALICMPMCLLTMPVNTYNTNSAKVMRRVT